MRRQKRAFESSEAWAWLATRRVVHLATTTPAGTPVLRVLNAAVHDGWVLFHGAIAGEKSLCLDRPAVVSAHHDVALVPSYFVDPEMACPATTYYRSVQVHGMLRDVDDLARKAAALAAFMAHQQPEGGHAPIRVEDPRYAKELRAVRVFGVEAERITGKESLGQDRPPERTQKVVEGLWRRGDPGDAEAIRMILDRSPAATPPWLRPPPALAERGITLVVHVGPDEAARAAEALARTYWRATDAVDDIRLSLLRSPAVVAALDAHGEVVGVARGLGDTVSRGSLHDVWVAEAYRGHGLGRALVRLALDHPALRRCAQIQLATKDRADFYAPFGFVPWNGPPEHTWMMRHTAR